jgi:hypothetical protein
MKSRKRHHESFTTRPWWPYLKLGALIVLSIAAIGMSFLAMSK